MKYACNIKYTLALCFLEVLMMDPELEGGRDSDVARLHLSAAFTVLLAFLLVLSLGVGPNTGDLGI